LRAARNNHRGRLYYQHLATRGRTDLPVEERHAIFVAGDDAEAKRAVSRLIEDIGFAPLDTGGLREGGLRQQPGAAVYNRPLTAREARQVLATEGEAARGQQGR
jgi:8-hydroxy-5-deazaflavin:NADPH oxidoreductase